MLPFSFTGLTSIPRDWPAVKLNEVLANRSVNTAPVGTSVGLTEFDALEATLLPSEFVARTVNV